MSWLNKIGLLVCIITAPCIIDFDGIAQAIVIVMFYIGALAFGYEGKKATNE